MERSPEEMSRGQAGGRGSPHAWEEWRRKDAGKGWDGPRMGEQENKRRNGEAMEDKSRGGRARSDADGNHAAAAQGPIGAGRKLEPGRRQTHSVTTASADHGSHHGSHPITLQSHVFVALCFFGPVCKSSSGGFSLGTLLICRRQLTQGRWAAACCVLVCQVVCAAACAQHWAFPGVS